MVSSFSWTLRCLMGYDKRLASDVLEAVAQTVREPISRRVKRECKLKSVMDVETGAVMFAQRFDSALRLNVHAHLLVLDSGYHWLDGKLVFHKLVDENGSGINQTDVEWIAQRVCAQRQLHFPLTTTTLPHRVDCRRS